MEKTKSDTSSGTTEAPTIGGEIATISAALAVLLDGKWDKRDATALVSFFGGLAGLVSVVVLALQSFGIL